jgi:oxaloacetate decarboxylase (Na+ extruding) subunit alpha
LELHSHCTIGLAEHTYMDAPNLGVSALQCASGAAADGTSNPHSARVVANLRALKHRVALDDEALAQVNQYFTQLAQAEGLPVGAPQAFDARYLQHQLPGGMVGTTRRQLAEARLSHLEGAVIEELGRVREELGWPIVMTPFAQILMTLAVMNVMNKERYTVIPDEAIRYAIGRFGRPTVPIAAHVMERIESLPRTRELRAEPEMASLGELRQRLGPQLGDEEFLLRATMPAGQVDAMVAAGPARRHYNPTISPVLSLIRKLSERSDLQYIAIDKAGMRLELRRHAPRAEATRAGAAP